MATLSDPWVPAPGANATETRVGVVAGDRLCIRCGFNLIGQTIVREPHYGLVMVRCPECSTAASIQEYPLLGRWAARWGMLFAGLWLAALLGLWAASAGILYGMASSIGWEAVTPYATAISERHQAWLKEQVAAGGAGAVPNQWMIDQGPGAWSSVDTGWWKDQDHDAVFAAAGGWSGAVDWTNLRYAVWGVIPIVPMGVFWAVAMLHVRGPRLLLVGAAIAGLAGAFVAAEHFAGSTGWGGFAPAMHLAQREVGMPFQAGILASFLVLLSAVLMVGRRAARLAIRALLPPRLRGPLAALWLADGLPPPGRA